jgi:pimeloyl-ACP methyl ester carboxylesterase
MGFLVHGLDYRTNVALHSKFHSHFRQYNPPTLIIWGRQDQYCTPAAATAYTRELPEAEIHIIEGGTGHSRVMGRR